VVGATRSNARRLFVKSKQEKYIFRERLDKEQRVKSAITLARLLLQDEQGVMERHRRELLDILIWKITEAESMNKFRTKYCSIEAYSLPDVKLEHEHVFEKEKLISELLRCDVTETETILSVAVACVVTTKEHERLKGLPKSLHGWDRYMAAKIPVVDVQETQDRKELKMFLDPCP
jgi:hypothetical protein